MKDFGRNTRHIDGNVNDEYAKRAREAAYRHKNLYLAIVAGSKAQEARKEFRNSVTFWYCHHCGAQGSIGTGIAHVLLHKFQRSREAIHRGQFYAPGVN